MSLDGVRDKFFDVAGLAQGFVKRVEPKSFLIGLGAVSVFYILFFIYAALMKQSSLDALEKGLAVQTVSVEHVFPIDNIIPQGQRLSGVSLVAAPEAGLYEQTTDGPLPVLRESDRATSFSVYRRPFVYPSAVNVPVLSIALSGYGLSQSISQEALRVLPPEVSFILSPYADNAQAWLDAARESGHEVWLEMPFENKMTSLSDPGPAAIMMHSTLDTNRAHMHWVLSQAAGYAGIAGFTDHSFSRAELMLENLVSELYKRGLGYLEMNGSAGAVLEDAAFQVTAPYIRSDIKGDVDEYIFSRLQQTIHEKNMGMVIVPAYPANIRKLDEWLHQERENYLFVPASAYYDAPLHVRNVSKGDLVPHALHGEDRYEPEGH